MSDVEPVPFLDLSIQYRLLEDEWLGTIRSAGETGRFILGPNVLAFEEELARFVGTKHAIGVANGTDALLLSLRAANIGPGDEVITTPFTFFATAEVVSQLGATPVFVDIRADTFNFDEARIEERITERTRAIVAVHLFGYPADLTALADIARRHKLVLIEDCAQAFGATWGATRVGAAGLTGCFSFYPTKVLGCYGDGGAVTTDSDVVAARIRQLRDHGASAAFVHDTIGFNSRLDEIQAALLRIKLRSIEDALAGRQAVAEAYDRRLSAMGVGTPSCPEHGTHAFNLYTIRAADRDRLRRALMEQQIGCSVYYPVPVHLQRAYAGLGYRPGDMPLSEAASREVLSLPIYPEMTPAQVERVCQAVAAGLGDEPMPAVAGEQGR